MSFDDEGNDIYDRRSEPREPHLPNIPKEGDTFKVPQLSDDGDLIGWYEYRVDRIGYEIDNRVFGVIPYEDDNTTYEIVWVDHMESWVQDGALG